MEMSYPPCTQVWYTLGKDYEYQYEQISAQEINRRVSEKLSKRWSRLEPERMWCQDANLAQQLHMYSSTTFHYHIKGGWLAANYDFSRILRCETLARVMCAAFLEWE